MATAPSSSVLSGVAAMIYELQGHDKVSSTLIQASMPTIAFPPLSSQMHSPHESAAWQTARRLSQFGPPFRPLKLPGQRREEEQPPLLTWPAGNAPRRSIVPVTRLCVYVCVSR
jgi:hypothetical protein